jgi:hypothetical protein
MRTASSTGSDKRDKGNIDTTTQEALFIFHAPGHSKEYRGRNDIDIHI